jgi:arginyl-tRNA synthetase
MAFAIIKDLVEKIENFCNERKIEISTNEIENSFIIPKEEFGDLSTTIAFQISKKLNKRPDEIAKDLAKILEKINFIKKVEVKGGYINFFFSDEFLISSLFTVDENFGKGQKNEKIIIEYPSVNPNKPWHVGHLRNALIGDCLSNILEFYGYKVERENFINDLGLQVVQSVWGYITSEEKEGDEKFDHYLGRKYVEIAKKEITDEVRNFAWKLEKGEENISMRTREICERCLNAQLETSSNYNIFYDVLIWESDILRSKIFEKTNAILKEKNIIKKVEDSGSPYFNCYTIELDPSAFPSLKSDEKVIIKSDGTSTYVAKDIAFQFLKLGIIADGLKFKKYTKQKNGKILYTTYSFENKKHARKKEEFKFEKGDKVINIIGSEQSYLQNLIKYIISKIDEEKAKNFVHLAYEHVVLPQEKFVGRLGTWIGYTADELLEEGIKRAKSEIEKRIEKTKMNKKEIEKIAKMVAISAIKFQILKVSPTKQIVFDFDRNISFEGNTGPYLQYSCVRAGKILEKLAEEEKETKKKKKKKKKDGESQKERKIDLTKEERDLIRKILEFPDIIEKISRNYEYYLLPNYSIELADLFNVFYEKCPVIKADEETKEIRRRIVLSYYIVLKKSLELMGIEVPNKM